jgi:Flp pilus assembly protein TadD
MSGWRFASAWVLAVVVSLATVGHAAPPATQQDAFAAARKLAAAGDHRAALAKYSQAFEANPKDGRILAYRALSHLALRQSAEAQQDVDRAMKLSDKEPVVLEAAGQVKIAEGKVADGRAMFEKAAEVSPKSKGAIYTDLAAALSARNDPKLAGDVESALKTAASADPPSPEALFQLGQAYANAGRQEGKQYLRKYLELSAKMPDDQRDPQKVQLAKQLIRALDVVQSLK